MSIKKLSNVELGLAIVSKTSHLMATNDPKVALFLGNLIQELSNRLDMEIEDVQAIKTEKGGYKALVNNSIVLD